MMSQETRYTTLLKEATAAGQEHIFNFYNELNAEEKESLLVGAEAISAQVGFQYLNECYSKMMKDHEDLSAVDELMEPLAADNIVVPDNNVATFDTAEWKLGMDKIVSQETAVVLLSGGQGSRLGFAHPKGMYNIGLPSNKTLFQIQAENILRLKELSGNNASIPFYIMTGEDTLVETREFFASHNFFGLPAEDVQFFPQGTLPCMTLEGKIMLKTTSEIAKAPNGNGGLYEALARHNIVKDMVNRNIEHVHIYCVDNVLCKVADPAFAGSCISKNARFGAKVVKKEKSTESVGVVCKVDGIFKVVEYSEVSAATSELTAANGDLLYNAGNICNHYVRMDFLEEIAANPILPFHLALKKIPTIDMATGEKVTIAKDVKYNGSKMEQFIFDVLGRCATKDLCVMYINRAEEFSPLKNASGACSPASCRQEYMEQSARFLAKAGIALPENLEVEVSRTKSYAGEGLSGKTLTATIM